MARQAGVNDTDNNNIVDYFTQAYSRDYLTYKSESDKSDYNRPDSSVKITLTLKEPLTDVSTITRKSK